MYKLTNPAPLCRYNTAVTKFAFIAQLMQRYMLYIQIIDTKEQIFKSMN